MDPLDAQIRQVFFFDTPELALNNAGVVVRARRVQNKGNDSVVKLRPIVPDALSKDASAVSQPRGRGRRDAGWVRVLGDAEGEARSDGGSRHDPRREADPEALLEGAARVLRRQCARGSRAGRALRPGADLRPQAEVEPGGIRASPRRRALALPGRLADPRAVDEVRHDRSDAGRGRGTRIPCRARASISSASSRPRRKRRSSSSRRNCRRSAARRSGSGRGVSLGAPRRLVARPRRARRADGTSRHSTARPDHGVRRRRADQRRRLRARRRRRSRPRSQGQPSRSGCSQAQPCSSSATPP